MARRIRWQILIAAVSSLVVLGLMSSLAITTASVPRPLSGGAYVEAIAGAPVQLNPLVASPAADPAAADIQALVFDGLMRIGPDGLPEPALAQLWESDEQGLVYTFTLRTDVTWHDGTPLSVDDVLFTLRALQGPAFAGDARYSAVWRTVLVDRAGERGIRCRLEAPFAPFLSFATFPILPAHLLRDVPPEQWAGVPFSRSPVGTGPYRLAELNAERALLAANPAYYGGRPFIDTVELRFVPSPQAALAALTRGEIHGMGFSGAGDLAQLNPPRGVVRRELPLDGYTVLTFNLRQGPLADVGLRRALALALDKDTLIERALAGQGARLDTPILPGWWAAAPDVQWYPADPSQAADVLDSLGYLRGPDGFRAREGAPLALTLITDGMQERMAVAQEIARQWGAAGVRVEVQQLDSGQLQARLAAHDFALALHGWQRLGPDPDVLELWHSSQAESGLNYAGLQDERIDELLLEARQEADIVTRAALYADFQARWVELAPSITLYQPLFVYDTTAELQGLPFDAPAGEAGAPPP
ncbi:MAG TPA: peptide ABC transporter substrate-binding protein, partial [Roseiflexaceae bacterium]|nr:peptide ABC transporter substrate-binding protein [Roseiflexaceae bacterium]